MLEALAEPGSATTLGRLLGVPRQHLNYHLHQLEKAGFVEEVETRRRRNCVERIVRATARSYLISPEVLGTLGPTPETQRDRFSAGYLMAAAGRVLRDLSEHVGRAMTAKKRVATLTLEADIRFASSEARTAFAEELSTAVAGLVARYHDASTPGGRTFRLMVGAYPAPARGSQAAGSQAARRKERPHERCARL
jgi:hypothetical protein